MSTTGLNKIVTSVSALTDNIIIPNANNVVCIDTENNRIGVKTSSPSYEIDVSGTINTNVIKIGNASGNADISYNNNHLNIGSSIFINNDISCNGNIKGNLLLNQITLTELKSNNIDISFAIIRELTYTNISGENIYVNNINGFNNNIISINANINLDGSLNMPNGTASIGSLITTSDDRLKHNEKNIINGLEIIRQLKPQLYQKTKNFKEENFIGPLNEPYILEAGLIAQEVKNINDLSFSVINGNNSSPYLLNYNNIFVYSLAALKELDLNVKNIENKINEKNSTNIYNKFSNSENNNLEIIINNQNNLIQELTNKIYLLENRIKNIENAF